MKQFVIGSLCALIFTSVSLAQCQGWRPPPPTAPGGRFPSDAVIAMAVVNFSFGVPGQPRLFLAGTFPDESVPSVSSTQLRYWDGQAFSLPFGPDFTDGRILAMTVFNGELILAGEFSRIGTLPVSNIVRYSSGLGWRPMGSGTFDGPIYALAELQGELVAAGDFVYGS